jgi:hypothetical protein
MFVAKLQLVSCEIESEFIYKYVDYLIYKITPTNTLLKTYTTSIFSYFRLQVSVIYWPSPGHIYYCQEYILMYSNPYRKLLCYHIINFVYISLQVWLKVEKLKI